MHIVVRGRIVLARHPWFYWLVVGGLAVGVGLLVDARFAALDAERATWRETRSVLVARRDLDPDSRILADAVDVPLAVVPDAALTSVEAGARARQRVTAGEILVTADIVTTDGPARHAAAGTLVAGIVDPLSPGARVGQRVQVVADGVVLAAEATVVDSIDDVVFVAVPAADGPVVAAAAAERSATLLFRP